MHFQDHSSLKINVKKLKFSLIELLVVVAIIGVLSSLLLPTLGKAREKGRIAVCLNNQKQISTATFLYMDDNEGYFPKADAATGFSWDDLLGRYDSRNLSDAEMVGIYGKWGASHGDRSGGKEHAAMYRCPLDEREDDEFILKTYDQSSLAYGGAVSAANQLAAHRGVAGFWIAGPGDIRSASKAINDISNSANVIAYAENYAPLDAQPIVPADNTIRLRVGNSWEWNGINPEVFELNEPGHSDMKFNFAMADGHVEKMNLLQSLIRSDGGVATTTNTTGSAWDSDR
jgi:prepilin-type N-terminal cleavage/methylation domain-containing protein/prepilin-type processing-associated H-X9-DG protein